MLTVQEGCLPAPPHAKMRRRCARKGGSASTLPLHRSGKQPPAAPLALHQYAPAAATPHEHVFVSAWSCAHTARRRFPSANGLMCVRPQSGSLINCHHRGGGCARGVRARACGHVHHRPHAAGSAQEGATRSTPTCAKSARSSGVMPPARRSPATAQYMAGTATARGSCDKWNGSPPTKAKAAQLVLQPLEGGQVRTRAPECAPDVTCPPHCACSAHMRVRACRASRCDMR